MDETRVLERALENCHNLERSIYESIRLVRRLNIRYNSDWLLKNYKNYMANIWSQYRCASPEPGRCKSSAPPQSPTPSPSSSLLCVRQMHNAPSKPNSKRMQQEQPMSARSSQELSGSTRRINYKFIRIKRSMEALIMQIQHAIEIANRQKNYVHVNVNGRDSRTRICCH